MGRGEEELRRRLSQVPGVELSIIELALVLSLNPDSDSVISEEDRERAVEQCRKYRERIPLLRKKLERLARPRHGQAL